jgi:hypothetical protein
MQLPGQVGSLDVSAKLDPREEYFRTPSSVAGLHLSLRYLPPQTNARGAPKVVLYVHGGTTLCTDDDARWMFDALRASPMRRDVKISRATHLMHLEEN